MSRDESTLLPAIIVLAIILLMAAGLFGAPLRYVLAGCSLVVAVGIVIAKVEDRRILRKQAAASGLPRHIIDATPRRRSGIGGGR
jgi:uncharacterized membrane protein YraQ (UPF0718 family)